MFALKKILAALVLPPAGPLLLAGFGLLLARRWPRAGRALAWFGLFVLTAMSMPPVSDMALRTLETYPPISDADLQKADVIVILAGGTYREAPEYGGDTVSDLSLIRCRYGARLARQTGLPVLVTGGVVFGGRPEARSMEAVLKEEFGVAVRFVEEASRDTRENAALSVPMLKAAGLTRVALVTHAFHMPRAVALFEEQGLTVLPAPTRFTGGNRGGIENWLPSVGALRNSYLFLHEWLGKRLA